MRPNTACAIIAAAGRSSARETASRVAAGAIARKIVPGMNVRGALVQMGPHRIDRDKWDWDEIARNPFFCPDKDKAAFFETYLDGIRKNGSSIGAVIEIVAEGVPAGLGAPIYAKLDGELAAALMSINAVKGVEIGAGFGAAELSARKTPTKCGWAIRASASCPIMPAAFWVASPRASRWWRALR